jgi:carbamoyl-phosphate synthase large subunit
MNSKPTLATKPEKGERQAVLILGRSNRALVSIVRSLGRAGYPVVLGRGDWPDIMERSRFTAEVWPHPSLRTDEAAFLDALATFIREREDIAFIFPTDDRELDVLARNASSLPIGAVAVMPDAATVIACLDKPAAAALAVELGIPVAPYRLVTDTVELTRAARETGLPCIVKPAVAHGQLYGRKAVICASEDDVCARFGSWPDGHDSLIVQAYVAGVRANIQFVARDGEIFEAFQYDAVRTSMPDGTGYSCNSMVVPTRPDLFDYTARLTRHFRYTGVGLSQFMAMPDTDTVSFLELNPRLGGTSNLGQAIGLDLPSLALALATGRPVGRSGVEFGKAIGRQSSSIHTDLIAVRAALRRREIGARQAARWLCAAAATFVRSDIDTIWSWRDPLPGIDGFARALRRRRRR